MGTKGYFLLTALCRFTGITDISGHVGKSLSDSGLPLLQLISGLPSDSSKVVQTDSRHIYKCSRSSFMDMGFPHTFYMIEPLTEELYEAEKRGYRKVIRIISHEVNNTMAGLTSANDFVRRVLPFLESLKGQRMITFRTEMDEQAGTVGIDPALMEQALTNIVKNAVEAFSEDSPDNLITITALPSPPRPQPCCLPPSSPPNPKARA